MYEILLELKGRKIKVMSTKYPAYSLEIRNTKQFYYYYFFCITPNKIKSKNNMFFLFQTHYFLVVYVKVFLQNPMQAPTL